MIESTKKMFINYANFKGRTSRRDFWLAYLGYFLLSIVVGFVSGLLGGMLGIESIIGLFAAVFMLGTILPVLSMQIRRLHDINKSGWWYLVSFVPFVGSIILLIFLCSASVNENNNY